MNDAATPRTVAYFPNSARGATGYVSDPFGKWFARFVKKTLGKDCGLTFHAFRHLFRDALAEADVSLQYVEALGGWNSSRRSAEKLYGKGPVCPTA